MLEKHNRTCEPAENPPQSTRAFSRRSSQIRQFQTSKKNKCQTYVLISPRSRRCCGTPSEVVGGLTDCLSGRVLGHGEKLSRNDAMHTVDETDNQCPGQVVLSTSPVASSGKPSFSGVRPECRISIFLRSLADFCAP